jgi:cellulase/cellobiase CelA1
MRYTKRERRLAVLAVVMAVVAAALLGQYLVRGATRPPESGSRVAEQRNTGAVAASPAGKPESLKPRVLTAGYTVGNRWKGGFNAEVVVTNTGSEPIEGWTVQLQLPAGVAVTQAWSADVIQKGAILTLRSQPWNTYLAPGAAIHLGFQATGTAASPSSCTINGSPC